MAETGLKVGVFKVVMRDPGNGFIFEVLRWTHTWD